jgi:hypothetical protein
MHIIEIEVFMHMFNAILELVGLKKNEEFSAQFATLTARPQYSNFTNVRGNNARTMNFNRGYSTAWTRAAVWF